MKNLCLAGDNNFSLVMRSAILHRHTISKNFNRAVLLIFCRYEYASDPLFLAPNYETYQ